MRTKKLGLVFGGRSAEHEVSIVSARTVATALDRAGYTVVPLGIAQDGCWVAGQLGEKALRGELDRLEPVGGSIAASLRELLDAEVDGIFPIVHGTWGEDGTLQGLCEMLDLPYCGTGVASSAVCMDKVLAKQVWEANGVPVVDYEVVGRRQLAQDRQATLDRLRRFALPLFVKPAIGGSSVGVSRVDEASALEAALVHGLRFDDRILVERGIAGRELEVAVLGYPQLEASGVGEIVPGKEFYDYADKYVDDGAQLIHAAEVSSAVEDRLRSTAIRAFEAVGGFGMARVDFLVGGTSADDQAEVFVNEINTLPGFTSISMYPKLWQRAGLEPAELVDRLVQCALRRHADRRRLDEGISEWIAGL